MTGAPDRARRPAARTPRPLVLPAFDRHTLGNGLRVEFARRTGVPEVSLRLVASAPRLVIQGLASSSSAALPAVIVGVDPEAEKAFSALHEKLEDGRWLNPDDRLRAYVGARLAEATLARAGHAYQRATDWHRRRPPL